MALASSLFGAELGDDAPPLQIWKWIKGRKVNMAKGKGENVYVLEFWQTGHLHNRLCVPFLTGVQKKFKEEGVVVIAITNEKPAVVKRYIEKMGEQLEYVVAIDEEGATGKAYLNAFGIENGPRPHAFVVDKEGRIVWHGHPLSDLAESLPKILAGEYDIEKAAAERLAQQRLAEKTADYMKRIKAGESGEETDALGEQLLEEGADDITHLNNLSWLIMTEKDVEYRNQALAMKLAQAAFDASDGETGFVLDTYSRALYEDGQLTKALQIQKKAIRHAKDRSERKQMEAHLQEYKYGLQ